MKLHEEFKLYENMWEARYCYIVLTGDFPNKYFVHGVVATEAEAKEILNKAEQGFSGNVEMAKLYDLADSEAARLEAMVGKEITGDDANFIADFFTDGSRVDSLYNNFNEAVCATTIRAKKQLEEARSTKDIEAEIARLQAELEQAKEEEKKASYGGKLPTSVWSWDIYLTPRKKGTWTGIDNDIVFETKEKALDGAWQLLNELDDEGELKGDPDDYTIDAFEVPLSSVSDSVLRFSNLGHLAKSIKMGKVTCCDCSTVFEVAMGTKKCTCPKCGVTLEINWPWRPSFVF